MQKGITFKQQCIKEIEHHQSKIHLKQVYKKRIHGLSY